MLTRTFEDDYLDDELPEKITGDELCVMVKTYGPRYATGVLYRMWHLLARRRILRFLRANRCETPETCIDDLAQEIWFAVFGDLSKYFRGEKERHYTYPLSWVLAIAVNHALLHCKSYAKKKEFSCSSSDEQSVDEIDNMIYKFLQTDAARFVANESIDAEIYKKEALERAQQFLATRPEIDQAIYRLYLNNLPYKKIAKILNLETGKDYSTDRLTKIVSRINFQLNTTVRESLEKTNASLHIKR